MIGYWGFHVQKNIYLQGQYVNKNKQKRCDFHTAQK